MHGERYSLPGVGRIPLREKDGAICAWATVDLADLPLVCGYGWYQTRHGYVIAHEPGNWPKRKVYMHRLLAGAVRGDGLHVDHRNRDRLDNRRSNLRIGTQKMNNQNTPGWRRSTSRYRGVCWSGGMWQAEATIDRRCYYLGRFADEDEAGRVASEFRRAHMPGAIEP